LKFLFTHKANGNIGDLAQFSPNLTYESIKKLQKAELQPLKDEFSIKCTMRWWQLDLNPVLDKADKHNLLLALVEMVEQLSMQDCSKVQSPISFIKPFVAHSSTVPR